MNANAALARYGLVAQTFHWCVVLLLIGLFVSNSLRESAPENEDWRLFWLNLHMSLGFLLCLVDRSKFSGCWIRRTRNEYGMGVSPTLFLSLYCLI
ncbi:cytochrome b/b6 domain-containing protein [uncultured Thiocystis sp.]|jgi:cytochrome b561|uniref:cytochrome b n=1 Tax=uncultured Thiocystis sp. TaxID=1202134 RepID=UPI0025FB7FD6|nr:cytochrome b/b6 domain-containing protein [uncultured Thiocystis sp.]